jgi:type IV pilus assembly protein PilM
MPEGRFFDIWRPRTAVGLSLGAASVTGVRLVRGDDGFVIEKADRAELPPDRPPHPTEIAAAAASVADSLMDDHTRLVVGLSGNRASMRFHDLPFTRPDKVRRILKYEAEPLFLSPIEDLVLDYLPLNGTGDGPYPSAVLAAPRDLLSAFMEDFTSSGLEPDAVLPERLAWLLAARNLLQDREGGFLLLDFGAGQTGICAVENGRSIQVRSIPYGGRDITLALAESLNIDIYEAENLKKETRLDLNDTSPAGQILIKAYAPIISEIRRTMVAADMESPTLILSGGGASTQGLPEFLSAKTGCPTQPAADFITNISHHADLPPGGLTALGLAMIPLLPGYQPNLLQGDLAPRQRLAKHSRALVILAAGIIVALGLNLGNFIFDYQHTKAGYQTARDEIKQILIQTVPGIPASGISDPLGQMKLELEQARARVAGQAGQGAKVLDIIKDLNQVAKSHDAIRITDLSLNPKTLELSGEGKSFESVDRFKTALTALPYFSHGVVGSARVDSKTKVLNFRITLTRSPS